MKRIVVLTFALGLLGLLSLRYVRDQPPGLPDGSTNDVGTSLRPWIAPPADVRRPAPRPRDETFRSGARPMPGRGLPGGVDEREDDD
jgi:hypothetical protein